MAGSRTTKKTMPFMGEHGEVRKEGPKEIIVRACYCVGFSKGNFSSAERPETPAGRARGKERQSPPSPREP